MAGKIQTSLKNLTHKVSLTKEEKADLKRQFLAFTDEHPAHSGGRVSTWSNSILSIRLFHSPVPYIAGILFIALTSGGVSYKANSALPGDALYPVKVSINEELIGLMHTTPKSKARYEARRLNERLDEVQQLTVTNRINSQIWHDMSRSLEAHVTNIKDYIETQDTPQEVATTSNATSSQTTGTTTPAKDTATSSASSTTTTETLSATSSTETAQTHEDTSQQLLEVQEQLNDSDTIPESERDELEDKYEKATKLFRKGLEHLESQRHRSALTHFERAQEIVNEIDATLEEEADTDSSAHSMTSDETPVDLEATSTPTTNGTSNASSTATTSTTTPLEE
ncbi:MAG: hypothetical protein WDZ82_00290 [Candidatus Paceibacterota bacterium]